MRETRYGLNLPYCTDVAAQARRIERLGFDYLTVGEHVSFHTPVPSALITLAYAAAVTTRVRLMSGILTLPFYPAATVAKMTAALDVLSGGRFELGVGVGGENPAEFAACGVPASERGKRADEALEVIRQLWTGKKVTFQGRFCTLTEVDIAPAPVQPGGPPIWISGRGSAALRRTAALGDGWFPYLVSPAMVADGLAKIRQLSDSGESSGPGGRAGVLLFACCHEDSRRALSYAVEFLTKQYNQEFSRGRKDYLVVGTPAECRQRLAEYRAAGCDLIVLASACPAEYRVTNEQLLAEHVLELAGYEPDRTDREPSA